MSDPIDEQNGVDHHDDGQAEFNDLLDYSRNITKTLFGKQLLIYPGSLNIPDDRTMRRRDALKRIKTRDQYGNLMEELVKPDHPLARPRPNVQLEMAPKENIDANAKESAAQKQSQDKTVALTKKIESAANSVRSLILPWMNSIDKKSSAMDEMIKPEWHPPWKLYRMISGHNGWVHSLAVDPSNMWFASGCRDGLIKIWDIASGRLRITLTGHISGVRGLAVSDRHPYLFSCGDDKMVKCWDLEQNQVVRHYHGHLSGVYCLAMHPTENIIVTGGRDSVARVWDMRSKEQIHCLTGHTGTVGALQCMDGNSSQLITGSYDTTIRLWDIKMGKTMNTLTNHKKSVRALALKHDKSAFVSGAFDNLKQWTLPDAKFVQNLSGHNSIINCLATNQQNVLVSGADDGTLFFWDWRTGHNFQKFASPVQQGSIESEASVLAMTFDRSGARLITGQSDKTIKMYREDPNASEETHPIDWKPDITRRDRF
uniref:Pleiotropic regulator 1 n=1 Tax=Aceria tosichella TaxID=561515 RepID=A0A6G1S526_9ACAR